MNKTHELPQLLCETRHIDNLYKTVSVYQFWGRDLLESDDLREQKGDGRIILK
jgi:hypothetical protein